MIWWDEVFCQQLADQGLFVIRYDQRDVGRSSCCLPGEINYDLGDLVLDAQGVLASFGVSAAHIVGMSLGGMIGQVLGLRAPEHVLSLICIASGIFDERPDLPPMDGAIGAYHSQAAQLDWSDEGRVCAYLVGGWRLLGGSRYPFDEARALALAEREFRRARSMPSMFNHAMLDGARDCYGAMPRINARVLAIHGTEDRVLLLPHAEVLVQAVPNGRLVTLDGAGHELHPFDWPQIIAEIAAHIRDSKAGVAEV